MTFRRPALLVSVFAGLVSSAPPASAQDTCPCPVDGTTYESTAETSHAGSDDPSLEAEQTQGSEPDDFEFEAPPDDQFEQEQTQGSEPDDFEFEGE